MGIFARKKDTDKKTVAGTEPVEVAEKKSQTSMKDLYGQSNGKKNEGGQKKDSSKDRKGQAYRILVKPLITEKASQLGAENKYLFEVENKTNKCEIKKAIEEIYGIKPTAVNIVKMQGKITRRGRQTGRRKNWKKAMVSLPKDKTINVYEGV